MPADSSSLSGQGHTVCVTGAGGFIASWIVKFFRERKNDGAAVTGTKNVMTAAAEAKVRRVVLTNMHGFAKKKGLTLWCNRVAWPLLQPPQDICQRCSRLCACEDVHWPHCLSSRQFCSAATSVLRAMLQRGEVVESLQSSSEYHPTKCSDEKNQENTLQVQSEIKDLGIEFIQ
uniref:NAD-dependent epimerase/dehydratase domain-containing protein n=1 Tax=Salix viminalis TaxID=40686 RepID=A0A6N2MPQ2_SALVM